MNQIGLIFACFLLGMSSPMAGRPISAPMGGGAPNQIALPADSQGPWTAVVFGIKGGQPEADETTEDPGLISQILVTADWQAGYVRLASVGTDLVAADDSFEDGQGTLWEIYRDSGPESCAEVLGRNLDVEVQDYFVVPWKAAADAVNILGGIDIEVTDEEMQQFNARVTEAVQVTGIASYIQKQAGRLHLDGVQAVAYMNLENADPAAEHVPEEQAARRHSVSEQVLKQAASAGFNDLIDLLEVVEPQIAASLTTQDFITILGGCRMVKSVESTYLPPGSLEDSAVYLNSFLYDGQN